MSYRRIIITAYGEPDVLQPVEEESLPEPQPGEARLKVLATSAAFTDTLIRRNKYPGLKEKPPFSPGYDLVGEVDKLGPGVSGLAVGQRVAELTVTGAYTEYICLPAERLVPVPPELDPAEAVSLILSYMTAYQMLHRMARLEPGQPILVHGAGGAVGTALLQLGRLLDLEMFGTASQAKHEVVAGLGAVPIDYKTEDFVARIRAETESGVQAAFDAIGGDNFKRSFDSLRPGGILVAYGFYKAAMGGGGSIPLDFIRLKLWNFLPNGRSTCFYSISTLRHQRPDWFREDLAALFRLLAEGKIQPIIARRMPLAEAGQAHRLVEQAVIEGKIVLMVNS